MEDIQFPTLYELNKIYKTSQFPRFIQPLNTLLKKALQYEGFLGHRKSVETREFILQLHHRLQDAAKSYCLMRYFLDKGIPDTEWFRSPGKDNVSVEYFPNFETNDFMTKEWFDFYCDTFYSKFFSSLDTIGHILNAEFALNIQLKNVSFNRALQELEKKFPAEYTSLRNLTDNEGFSKAKNLRNDITHNISPNTVGTMITPTEHGWSFGLRPYVSSADFIENANLILDSLDQILAAMAEFK